MEMDKYVCRFFFAGKCVETNCLFPHVQDSQRRPDSVCRFHLKKKCIYGKRCRYDHISLMESRNKVQSVKCVSKHEPSTHKERQKSQLPVVEKKDILDPEMLPSNEDDSQSINKNSISLELEGQGLDNLTPLVSLSASPESVELKVDEVEIETKKINTDLEYKTSYNPFINYIEAFPYVKYNGHAKQKAKNSKIFIPLYRCQQAQTLQVKIILKQLIKLISKN